MVACEALLRGPPGSPLEPLELPGALFPAAALVGTDLGTGGSDLQLVSSGV